MTHARPRFTAILILTAASSVGAQAIGDTDTFGARIQRVAYGPDRATYTLKTPAYVTLISVTEKAIHAIVPVTGMKSRMEGSGDHVASMGRQTDSAGNRVADRFGADRAGAEDMTTTKQLNEYNRCLARARSDDARRREAARRVIGRDAAGNPIYAPPEPSAADNGRDPESRCRVPAAPSPQASASRPTAKAGRFLLLYASDTPIEYRDIADLVVTEGDIRSVTKVVGDKLFGIRGARWSAHYVAW